jgi:ATP-dependent DNA helicase PIF1
VVDLVNRVYGNDIMNADANAMVLTLTLDDADTINTYCIEKCAGYCREVHAADVFVNCRHPDMYPPEVVASMRMPGVPPSCLQMKLGGRYMIIKNISKDMFNGVRCVLVAFAGSKCVFVRLISGPAAGTTTIVPSCVFNISPEQSGLPFNIRRRQFPMILSYAVTVHKAQGQTLVKVGLYMTTAIFTHGQLYTALSRTRGWCNIVIWSTLPNPGLIVNCVCRHVLQSFV